LFNYNIDKVINYQNFSSTTNSYFSGDGSTPIIGKPLLSIYSYRWAGLDPTKGDPRVLLGDTVSTFNNAYNSAKVSDLKYNGPQRPMFFGSLQNTLLWKNLSLSFNVVYKLGYYFRRSSINYTNIIQNSAWGGSADYTMRWQNPGDEKFTNVPSLPASANIGRDYVYQNSDILVEKGDHIRLQDIRLTYNFSKQAIKTSALKNVQLYIYANNIGIIWRANKNNIDPDYGSTNVPNPKSIAFGLNIGF